MVLSRIVAAGAGGFLIASLSVPVLTRLFSASGALAAYSAMMFSFIVWLIFILWAFSTAKLKRVWLGTAGTIVALALLALLFQP